MSFTANAWRLVGLAFCVFSFQLNILDQGFNSITTFCCYYYLKRCPAILFSLEKLIKLWKFNYQLEFINVLSQRFEFFKESLFIKKSMEQLQKKIVSSKYMMALFRNFGISAAPLLWRSCKKHLFQNTWILQYVG